MSLVTRGYGTPGVITRGYGASDRRLPSEYEHDVRDEAVIVDAVLANLELQNEVRDSASLSAFGWPYYPEFFGASYPIPPHQTPGAATSPVPVRVPGAGGSVDFNRRPSAPSAGASAVVPSRPVPFQAGTVSAPSSYRTSGTARTEPSAPRVPFAAQAQVGVSAPPTAVRGRGTVAASPASPTSPSGSATASSPARPTGSVVSNVPPATSSSSPSGGVSPRDPPPSPVTGVSAKVS